MITSTRRAALAGSVAAALIGAVAIGSTAHADPQGFIPAQTGVGYFYGTFNDGPNVTLLVGGTAEDFCNDAPDDPFGAAEPGSAPLRIFERRDGAVDLKVNDKDQPVYLYETAEDAPIWISGVCADLFDDDPATLVQQPAASGVADLKVRISLGADDVIDVFNSVNGELEATDGTHYRVRASADLTVVGGVPVGNPADFVSLDLKEIRR